MTILYEGKTAYRDRREVGNKKRLALWHTLLVDLGYEREETGNDYHFVYKHTLPQSCSFATSTKLHKRVDIWTARRRHGLTVKVGDVTAKSCETADLIAMIVK